MNFSENEPLSDLERTKLKSRIIRSAKLLRKNAKRQRRATLLYGAAASIALLFAVFTVFDKSSEQSLQDYIDENKSIVDFGSSSEVIVVLGEREKIQLNEKNNTLRYSSTGKDLHVGTGEKYRQTIEDEKKPVFNTILVPFGKRTDVTLSDGTKIWINSGSRLIYPAFFRDKEREVFLEGEAIFEVAHNPSKPFRVISTNQEINVLGTVFNVSSYPDDEMASTVLKSGSVLVTYDHDDEKSFKMAPGTMAGYNTKTKEIEMHDVNIDEYFGWREGFLNLKNRDLEYITTKLSRYYGVEIFIKENHLKTETFSGKLDLKENLGQVIQTIGEASNFSAEYQTDKIILASTKLNLKDTVPMK